MRHLPFLIGAALLACTPGCGGEFHAYSQAKDANTPEAYRQFLEQYPDGVNAVEAGVLYDAALWTYALEADTSAAYQEYVDALPQGEHADEARSAVATIAWREAEEAGDRAAVEAFLRDHGSSSEASQARKWLALRDLLPQHVEIGATRFEETTPGHWTVAVDVRNIGERPVRKVRFRVAWLDDQGHIANSRRETLVDADGGAGSPIEPGQSRTFSLTFSRAQAADDWVADADHTRVEIVELEVAS